MIPHRTRFTLDSVVKRGFAEDPVQFEGAGQRRLD